MMEWEPRAELMVTKYGRPAVYRKVIKGPLHPSSRQDIAWMRVDSSSRFRCEGSLAFLDNPKEEHYFDMRYCRYHGAWERIEMTPELPEPLNKRGPEFDSRLRFLYDEHRDQFEE